MRHHHFDLCSSQRGGCRSSNINTPARPYLRLNPSQRRSTTMAKGDAHVQRATRRWNEQETHRCKGKCRHKINCMCHKSTQTDTMILTVQGYDYKLYFILIFSDYIDSNATSEVWTFQMGEPTRVSETFSRTGFETHSTRAYAQPA